MTKKKLKLKKPAKIILGIFALTFICFLLLFIGYSVLENKLNKLGYSDDASYNIITMFKMKYVEDYSNNKTLNAAFESSDYKEDNLEHYSKITYREQKNLIKNINSLLKKGYSDREISMIITHGDDDSVSNFVKKDKVEDLEDFF